LFDHPTIFYQETKDTKITNSEEIIFVLMTLRSIFPISDCTKQIAIIPESFSNTAHWNLIASSYIEPPPTSEFRNNMLKSHSAHP
jgi:hypothetical protein